MARNSTGSKARARGAERVITAGARPPRVDMGRASTRVDARAMRWTPRSRLVATTLAVTLAACTVRVAEILSLKRLIYEGKQLDNCLEDRSI